VGWDSRAQGIEGDGRQCGEVAYRGGASPDWVPIYCPTKLQNVPKAMTITIRASGRRSEGDSHLPLGWD
jgi:hypothetical protein